MRKITALEQQKRNKERISVFLNGEFAFGLHMDVARGLRVGQQLTDEAIAQLQDEETLSRARQTAFRYLSYRPRSIAEVRRNLQRKDYDEVVIEAVINDLIDRDYLNDEEFAAYWVEQRESFKPRSHLALRQELYEKGVPRAIISRVVQDVDEDEAAVRAAEGRAIRWSNLPEDEFYAKMIPYLRRRGFHYRIAKKTTDYVWRDLQGNESSSQRR